MLGSLVNSIWNKQGVWITVIPTTQEECESNNPGNGDFRLKLCQDGKGYFLQRIFNKKGAFGDDWQAVLPEFWGHMEEKYGLSPRDAMKSSIAAFNEGGFEFKPDSLIGTFWTPAVRKTKMPSRHFRVSSLCPSATWQRRRGARIWTWKDTWSGLISLASAITMISA